MLTPGHAVAHGCPRMPTARMACLNYRPSAVHIGEGLDVAVLVFAKNARSFPLHI